MPTSQKSHEVCKKSDLRQKRPDAKNFRIAEHKRRTLSPMALMSRGAVRKPAMSCCNKAVPSSAALPFMESKWSVQMAMSDMVCRYSASSASEANDVPTVACKDKKSSLKGHVVLQRCSKECKAP